MIYFLDDTDLNWPFPDVEQAELDPNGLLAIGGDLKPRRLINAYINGIFPWYSSGQPILWWTPNPRLVLFPEKLHISQSLRKAITRNKLTSTFDQAFSQVINACAGPRISSGSSTWLVQDMIHAYERLHNLGFAHSVETWEDGLLVGGLYGVAIGQVFFGESMFSYRNNASKIALVYLTTCLKKWDYKIIDCQVRSEHLLSMGAQEIPRQEFTQLLKVWASAPACVKSWL